MNFIPAPAPPETGEALPKACYFAFSGNAILIDKAADPAIPQLTKAEAAKLPMAESHFFGTWGKSHCYCGSLAKGDLPGAYSLVTLRAFYHRANDEFRQMAGYARQIIDLHMNFKFCGRCGRPTRPVTDEHARDCTACGLRCYPRISPAVIMAVTRGNEILLARGVNFPNKKMFSVLAGFVSPSETLEACVAREVYEETRIRVARVAYVRSQPWPFPDSLMIGFTADYESGDIVIDPCEIAEAAWFRADDLPLVPDAHTLAGQLIRTFAKDRAS